MDQGLECMGLRFRTRGFGVCGALVSHDDSHAHEMRRTAHHVNAWPELVKTRVPEWQLTLPPLNVQPRPVSHDA